MPQPPKLNKTLIQAGLVLVVMGVVGLAIPILFLGYNNRHNFEEEVAQLAQAQTHILSNETVITVGETLRPDYALSGVKNRLIIAKIEVDMPLFAGDSERILSKGGWLFPTNPTPAEGGNTAIFGHRFKYLPPISNTFYNLDKMAVGDEFYINWGDQRYNYRVTEVKIVEPTDVWILNPTDHDQVTLITCTPLFSTAQRLVVVANRI